MMEGRKEKLNDDDGRGTNESGALEVTKKNG